MTEPSRRQFLGAAAAVAALPAASDDATAEADPAADIKYMGPPDADSGSPEVAAVETPGVGDIQTGPFGASIVDGREPEAEVRIWYHPTDVNIDTEVTVGDSRVGLLARLTPAEAEAVAAALAAGETTTLTCPGLGTFDAPAAGGYLDMEDDVTVTVGVNTVNYVDDYNDTENYLRVTVEGAASRFRVLAHLDATATARIAKALEIAAREWREWERSE